MDEVVAKYILSLSLSRNKLIIADLFEWKMVYEHLYSLQESCSQTVRQWILFETDRFNFTFKNSTIGWRVFSYWPIKLTP